MLDIRLLREDPDGVKRSLARRGVDDVEVDRLVELDVEARARRGRQESLRARVKDLSRQVGEAKRAGDDEKATALSEESKVVGDDERAAAAEADVTAAEVRTALLYLPNIPAEDAPDGSGEQENVEVRRWWPGSDDGDPEPAWPEHQRVPTGRSASSSASWTWSAVRGWRARCSPLPRGRGATAASAHHPGPRRASRRIRRDQPADPGAH